MRRGHQKWLDRFLTNEGVAQNWFLSLRQSKFQCSKTTINTAYLRNERLQLNKIKRQNNLPPFCLFFPFDLYTVQYRAETEIC